MNEWMNEWMTKICNALDVADNMVTSVYECNMVTYVKLSEEGITGENVKKHNIYSYTCQTAQVKKGIIYLIDRCVVSTVSLAECHHLHSSGATDVSPRCPMSFINNL